MFQLDSREMMFAKQANCPDGTIVWASALASVGVSPMPRFVDDPDEVVEVDVGAVVLVFVGVGVLVAVEVEVCVGSGVWVVDVLVDVGIGTGAALEEESELGSGLVGAPGAEVEDCPRLGRARSRFAAPFAVRAASAFAAATAAAVFDSCDAASALLRSPSWCRWNAVATPPLTARTLVTAAAVFTLPLALLIAPGLAWLATCLPEPDMPDKRGLPPNFASCAREEWGCSFERPREACREANLPEVTVRSQWERLEDDRDFAESWHYTAEPDDLRRVVTIAVTCALTGRAHAPDARAYGRASASCNWDARAPNGVHHSG